MPKNSESPMRLPGVAIGSVVVLLATLLVSEYAFAVPSRYSFEDLPPGTVAVQNKRRCVDATQCVTIENVVGSSHDPSITENPNIAYQPSLNEGKDPGRKFLEYCSFEFCQVPLKFSFDHPQYFVSIRVGTVTPRSTDRTVLMRAFNSGNGLLAESRVVLPRTGTVQRISHLLQITRMVNEIAQVDIRDEYNSTSTLAVDYLLFERGSPGLTIYPDPVDFGAAQLGASGATRRIQITSTGSVQLVLGAITIGGANPKDFNKVAGADRCSGKTLNPRSSCTIDIRFRPLGEGGRNSALLVPSNASSTPRQVALFGTGSARPVPGISVDPDPVDFGESLVRGPGPVRRLTVTSSGTARLTLGASTVEGTNPTDFVKVTPGDNCTNKALDPGTSCSIDVRFEPKAEGLRTATLTISSDASSPRRVALFGNARISTAETSGPPTTDGAVTTATTAPPDNIPPGEPSGSTLVLDPALGPSGFVTTARGAGFPKLTDLTLSWQPGIGQFPVRTDASGAFTIGVPVFPHDRLGERALVATAGPLTVLQARFLVVPSPVEPSGGELAQLIRFRLPQLIARR